MLRTLGLLLGCQLAGEFIARGLGLPIPGPVLGLVILLAALALRPPLASALRPTTQVILAHLSLMVANGSTYWLLAALLKVCKNHPKLIRCNMDQH